MNESMRYPISWLTAILLSIMIWGSYLWSEHSSEQERVRANREVNTVKLTYELRGERKEEVKDARSFGYYGRYAAIRFAENQNDQADSSIRPLSRVVHMEYCPYQRPCEDITPRKEEVCRMEWKIGDEK